MDLYLPPMYRLVFLGFLAFFQCKVDQKADLILFNGVIYTANESNQVVNSMAIKDGWILETGDQDHIMKFKSEQTQMMDLSGQFVMPGLIEGHGHFLKLGKNLILERNYRESTGNNSEYTPRRLD
jgi:predicted amidohydrolase YtcJ